jgi:hypothetical protein
MTYDFEKTLQINGIKYKLKYFETGKEKKLGHMFSILNPEYEESVELIEEMLTFYVNSNCFK